MTPAQEQLTALHRESRELLENGFRVPEYTPSYTLDRQIVKARANMGIRRWNELEAEWLS